MARALDCLLRYTCKGDKTLFVEILHEFLAKKDLWKALDVKRDDGVGSATTTVEGSQSTSNEQEMETVEEDEARKPKDVSKGLWRENKRERGEKSREEEDRGQKASPLSSAAEGSPRSSGPFESEALLSEGKAVIPSRLCGMKNIVKERPPSNGDVSSNGIEGRHSQKAKSEGTIEGRRLEEGGQPSSSRWRKEELERYSEKFLSSLGQTEFTSVLNSIADGVSYIFEIFSPFIWLDAFNVFSFPLHLLSFVSV